VLKVTNSSKYREFSPKACLLWKKQGCGVTDMCISDESESLAEGLGNTSGIWHCSDSADALVTTMCHFAAIDTIP